MSTTPAADSQAQSPIARLAPRVLHAAWLSISLGLALELLLLLIATLCGENTAVNRFIADFMQKVTWSSFVCVGLAAGTAAARARVAWMGLLGLLAAPLGFVVARSVHKSVAAALSAAGPAAGVPGPLALALIKGAEYAVLGLVLGWLSRRAKGGLLLHVGCGALVGAAFGGMIFALTVRAATVFPSPFQLASRFVNELLFPIGCATVLYVTQSLAARPGAK